MVNIDVKLLPSKYTLSDPSSVTQGIRRGKEKKPRALQSTTETEGNSKEERRQVTQYLDAPMSCVQSILQEDMEPDEVEFPMMAMTDSIMIEDSIITEDTALVMSGQGVEVSKGKDGDFTEP